MGGGNASLLIASTDSSELKMSFSEPKIAVSPEQTSPTNTNPNLPQVISNDNGKTGWYGGVGLGLNSTRFVFPSTDTSGNSYSDSLDTRSGIGFNGFAGYKFSNFRAEGELLYTSNSIFQKKTNGFVRESNFNLSQIDPLSGNINNFAVMVNGYYDIETGSQFKPFVGVGMGFSSASVTVKGEGTVVGQVQEETASASEFTYQFKIGTAYAISDSTDLYLQYRYLKGPSTLRAGSASGGVDYNNSSFEFGTRLGF
jgi:opacity protein-like surface antigen